MDFNIEKVEKELNKKMQQLKFVHPLMKTDKKFTFKTHNNFRDFCNEFVNLRKIGHKNIEYHKSLEDILKEINNCVFTIVLYYSKYAKNKEDRDKYQKDVDFMCPKIVTEGNETWIKIFFSRYTKNTVNEGEVING